MLGGYVFLLEIIFIRRLHLLRKQLQNHRRK